MTYWYGVATISRLLEITDLFCRISLFYRAHLQERPVILRSLLIEATPYVWYDGLIRLMWLIHMCDSFICVTCGKLSMAWLIHVCHTCRVTHGTCTDLGVALLVHMCGMTHSIICVIRSTHLLTGWPRLIRCLKLQFIVRKRATHYRAVLQEMTYKDKASYDFTPPCSTHVC